MLTVRVSIAATLLGYVLTCHWIMFEARFASKKMLSTRLRMVRSTWGGVVSFHEEPSQIPQASGAGYED